jgi:ribosomal-protein-alanine N-acetyltransferase
LTVSLRPATTDDVPFLVRLYGNDDVVPWLAAVRAATEAEVVAEIARAHNEPDDLGVLVIEVDGERAGSVTWERVNRRSRIASVGGFALDPTYRGRGVADEATRILQRRLLGELGFHRIQMEIYGFNERAIRHAERSGWIREGVRRRAYWRNDAWVDGVLFGLVQEDLENG